MNISRYKPIRNGSRRLVVPRGLITTLNTNRKWIKACDFTKTHNSKNYALKITT